MANTVDKPAATAKCIQITPADLPLACPIPQITLWDMHPKVYLALKDGTAVCPYCGTRYNLASKV